MKMFRTTFASALLTTLLVAPCYAADQDLQQPLPEHLFRDRGCAVLAGGSIGARFSDVPNAELWFEANKKVVNTLYEKLLSDNHKVFLLLVPPQEASEASKLMLEALARQKCNRVIQVSSIAGEDAFGKYFGFALEVLRIRPKAAEPMPGDRSTKVEGEYQKRYRYERSAEQFENFSFSELGRRAYTEVKSSGVLENMK